jgi:hypothetical protein
VSRWVISLALVLSLAACSATSQAASDTPTPSATTASSTPTPIPTATPRVTPTPALRLLLDLKGSGIQRSAKFTTAGDWTITWSYDCSKYPGGTGIFQIYVKGDTVDVATNGLGQSGSGTQPEYTGAGTFYLEMNSVCAWRVIVKGATQ